jgi:asparaginyl-tRNA synthetase
MVEPKRPFLTLTWIWSSRNSWSGSIVQTVLAKNRTQLEILERDIVQLEKIDAPFPRITYDEAIEILRQNAVLAAGG